MCTRVEQADVRLIIDVPAEDLFVAADMVQLEQVLMDLIGNACDVQEGRSRRQIRVDARRDGDQVRVHEGGPGIAAQNLEKIFDPFLPPARPVWVSAFRSRTPSRTAWADQG